MRRRRFAKDALGKDGFKMKAINDNGVFPLSNDIHLLSFVFYAASRRNPPTRLRLLMSLREEILLDTSDQYQFGASPRKSLPSGRPGRSLNSQRNRA